MAVTTAVISGLAAVGSAVVSTVNNVQQQKALAAQNEYNAQVAEQDAVRARAESAMNQGLLRANARRQIATAQNQMAATGNVGSSADAVIMDAYLNLSSDLGAMKYQSDNTAIKYLNEARNYQYNKEVAKRAKTGAYLGGLLNVTSAVGNAYTNYSFSGGEYGFNYWR